ncbi:MAG: phage tail spike protein [Fusobacteriaceae bacterium]
MLRIFNSNSNDFSSNGLGILKDAYDSKVTEIQNGMFELEFKYLVGSKHTLEEDMLITADASPDLRRQAFRIYHISKDIKGVIDIKAQHISYDLLDNFLEKLELKNVTCQVALNEIFKNATQSNNFKGYSDIHNAQDYAIECVNAYEAIKGTKGSIIDTFGLGAKIKRDNYNIHVLNSRGSSNNVLITYRKNLKDIEATYDYQDLVTKIYPYAMVDNVKITLPEKYLTSSRIGKYAREKIRYIDFSGDDVTNIEQLRNKALGHFDRTKCDLPKANYKINLILGNPKYKELNQVSIDDEVIVRDLRLGINATARVIRVDYDPINHKYISIEVGDIINHLTKEDNKLSDLEDKVNRVEDNLNNLDVNVDDSKFPNTLPSVPQVKAQGIFATVDISWTFESKSYYNYEVYASQIADFNPDTTNHSNRVFVGKASSFVHEVKPHQSWYYKVRAGNTHGLYTLFSSTVKAETAKLSDAADYFEEAAIDDALIGTLRADRAWVNKFSGNYIDARNLTVTDGNGKRTLDIDSFGRIKMDVSSLSIRSKDVDGEIAVNLIPNSNFSMKRKTDFWSFWQSDYNLNGCNWYEAQHGEFPMGEGLGLSSNLNQSCTATSELIPVEYGEYYTLSLDLYVEPNVTSAGIMFRYYNQEGMAIHEDKEDYIPGNYGTITRTTYINSPNIKKVAILIWNNGATVSNKEYVVVFFNRIQFQKGKTRTPWKLATTDSLIQNIADIRVEATGIKQTVEHINGDYASKSTVTQLDNKVEYKFENSGKFNMIRNSVFTKGLKGWENLDCAMAYGFSGCPVDIGVLLDDCSGHNQTRYIWQRLDIRSDSVGAYTFSGYVWTNHSEFIEGEGKDYPMCNVYLTVIYKDDTYEWYNYDLRDNSRPQQWRKFKCTFVNQKPIKNIDFYIYKRNCTGVMYVTQLKGEEGWEASAWSPSPNEIYSNITTVDGQGIEIAHDSGAKSRMTHDCSEFTASNGNKVLRIKDGGMNFFTWDVPEMVGFIKPSMLAQNAIHNGVSLSTYASGDFITIGHSDSSDEGSWKTTPYILVCKHDLPYATYLQGVNFTQRSIVWHPMFIKDLLDMGDRPIEFFGNSAYNSKMYGYDGGNLAVFGDNMLRLGFREGTAYRGGLDIMESPGWQNNCSLRIWGEFDFQNYRVHNFRASYTLEPKSMQGKNKMKREDKKLYTSYTTNQDEIRHSGKSTTFGNSAIIELPINIAENINNDYIVHLTKYGRGDIWIKETNPYYFIVESDVEDLGFSYEVVATKLEEREIDSRMRIDYETNTESPEEIEPPNATFEDLTEVKENEYWKLYKNPKRED